MQAIDTLRSVLRFRRIERDPALRRIARAADVGDLRRIARRRLPAGVFDYIDGAAEDEITAARNVAAYRDLEFVPRVLRDVSTVDTTTTIGGRAASLPLILAPTGFTRIADPRGELAVARAAARAGVPYTLSTLSTRSIEDVAGVSDGDLWFQVYVWRDTEMLADMLTRAAASGYSTIVITVDTAVLGRRERDVRRGFSLPPRIGPGTLVDGAMHPGWTRAFLAAEPIRFANVVGGTAGDGSDAVSLADYIATQFDPALSWDDIAWFRERWDGNVVLKGVQSADDARRAADAGVDAVALSNHGGRQLDGAPTPVDLVAPARDAVGDAVEIYCDGGVRRGSDVVKALALGADAVMVGRAYLYGLAAGGEAGVDHVIGLLRSGMERTMALSGRTSVADIDHTLVRRRPAAD